MKIKLFLKNAVCLFITPDVELKTALKKWSGSSAQTYRQK
jgi:hypothetical protein